MAAGGLALAPLLIHLLSRQGYRRAPWAAMQFLAAAERRSRRRLRLEQWLLVMLRAMVVLVAGLTLARPFASGGTLLDALGESRTDRVIVIDDSLSMYAEHADGSSSIERARRFASILVEQAAARDGIALVRAGRPARALVDRPTRDRQVVERLLGEWTGSSAMNDLHDAIHIAAQMLALSDVPPGGRVCYVLTDFTRSAIDDRAGAGDSREPGHIDRLVFINVGPPQRDNLSITGLALMSQVVGAGVPSRFSVEVSNSGSAAVEDAELEISLDGVPIRSMPTGPISAGESITRDFDAAFARAGSHRLRAKLTAPSADVLPRDNERFLAVEVTDGVRVLGIEETPVGGHAYSGLFYYAAAVSPDTAGESARGIAFRCIEPRGMDQEALDQYDVIVVCDPRQYAGDWLNRIERFVRGGGGLIAFLGKNADPSALGRSDTSRAQGLLPLVINGVTHFDEKAGLPRFEIADPRDPVTADLFGNPSGGLQRAWARACWRGVARDEDRGTATHLQLSTGEPVAVSGPLGRGRVVAWLAGGDMSWTNLPAKPDFVPLMLNLTLRAAGDRTAERNILVGEVLRTRYPARLARGVAQITSPEGLKFRSELVSDPDGAWLELDSLEEPGFYAIRVAGDRRDVAVNVDVKDRDLSLADADSVRKSFGNKVQIVDEPEELMVRRARSGGGAREFARVLMVCLLGLVVVETLVGAWFGGRR
ncbi:MAG: hypothetical protein DCC65_03125 [Planctomycetota bacterium]|nr:MAG: hypothetical protein DCC65_03125 [Planctomycetota bacterium]